MAAPAPFVRIGGPPGGGGARSARIPGSAGEPRRAGRVPRVGMPNRRVAGAVRALHGPPAPQPKARAAAPAQPKSTPYVHWLGTTFGFNRGEGQGIEGLLNSSQQARQKVELEPLQQKGREIQNTENTVRGRYEGATNQMNQLLSGLTGQAEGSAKTFENTAAENALAATRSVETAGQNATTATGGYINPELRSILQSTGTAAQNLAQGGVNRANELGQANTNYMRQLAAAAAIGAGTGPGGGLAQIANRYQTQAGQNRAAENQVLTRGAARNKEERLTFPKELLTSRLGQAKLANEGIKIGQKGQEIGLKATETGSKVKARSADERYKELEGQWKVAGLTGTERQRAFDRKIKAGQLSVNQLNAADKAAYDRWKMTQSPAAKGGIKFSAANAAKWHKEYGTVESAARAKGLTNKSSQAEYEKVRAELRNVEGKAVPAQFISAALNMIKYGRLGPNDKKYAKEIGAEPPG